MRSASRPNAFTGPIPELSRRAAESAVRSALRRLEEGPEQLVEILAESARPLLAFAADRRVLAANAAAEAFFGSAPDELAGRSVDDLVPPRWPASPLAARDELATIDLPVLRRDGTELRSSLTFGCVRASAEPLSVVLVRDREEIDDAIDELHANEERYRLLIDGVREYALFMLDAEGRVATWNTGAERTKGWTEREILGQPYDVFFGAEDRAAGVPAQLLASARAAGSVEATGWHVRRDGAPYFVESFVTSLHAPDGQFRGYAVVTHDLSSSLRAVENEHRLAAERAAREAAELSEQRLRSVHRLALALSSAVTSEEVAEITLAECLRESAAAGGSVYAVGPDEGVLTLLAERGPPSGVVDPFRSIPMSFHAPVSSAARTGAAAFCESAAACIEKYPDLRAAVVAGGLEALSATPLAVRGRTIGVLVVRYARPRSFDAAVRSQHLTMAELCAQALDRARLFASERAARADAERAAQRATGILESMGDAFIALDDGWRITSVNRRGEDISQTRREDVVGKSLWDVFPAAADPQSKYWIELHRCVAARARVHFEERYAPLDVWTELDAYPAPDGGVAVFFRDVTARKRLEAERERLYEAAKAEQRRAEEANRAKDEFLAVVSHELRTPLNAVLGWTRMLRAGTLAEGQAPRALETIERNATAQAALINDILDVSRIITGKLRLDVSPVDLHDVIEGAIDALRMTADAKGVRVVSALAASGPVIGDPARLQQVIWNLLSNALKFTPRGGRVEARMTSGGANVVAVIEDTGEGIEPAFLPHVFERFRQQDGSTTRAHGGLGLGLAIVRHLVELHGGSVRAESEGKGRGARFIVEIPMASVRFRTAAPPIEPRELVEGGLPAEKCPAGLGGLRVLVVDDEADARDMVSAMLVRCDVQVRAVASAREALSALDEAGFDAIVSDVGMPAEDGYTLIEQVRLRPAERGGRTPAVALTAYARVEDRARALLAGFQMHLAKPVDPAELLIVLANVAQESLLSSMG
jgi:PAS domain S-box-containing protein